MFKGEEVRWRLWKPGHVRMSSYWKHCRAGTCLPRNPLRIACECHGSQHCDLAEDTTFPEFLSVLQENWIATLCSVQLPYCRPLHDTVTCPFLSDLLWLLWEFCWLIMAHCGEGRNNVLILHSYPHICISMSWISRCWVLQLGILLFPATFWFSSGFNLCGLQNASRLWDCQKLIIIKIPCYKKQYVLLLSWNH